MTELEKAAEKYVNERNYSDNNNGYSPGEVGFECEASFKEGAQWQAKQSPWISVADEEPPEYKDVLLSAGSRPDIFVGYFNGKDFRCRSTGDEIEYFRVLHWCSIPE